MITIGICDDDIKMRKALRPVLERTLELWGAEYSIWEYSSGEEFITQVKGHGPDILFLDIEMDHMDGIRTAKEMRRKGFKTIIIFVTAYPDFVFQGYEVHAFHYILKPYREKKIVQVTEQALKELEMSGDHFYTVEQKSKTFRIDLKRTKAFQSERRKILAHTEEGTVDFYGKLDDIEADTPDYFIRIHNRYLVNLNWVTAIEKDHCICGEQIFPVSRAYKQNLEVAFARLLLK